MPSGSSRGTRCVISWHFHHSITFRRPALRRRRLRALGEEDGLHRSRPLNQRLARATRLGFRSLPVNYYYYYYYNLAYLL